MRGLSVFSDTERIQSRYKRLAPFGVTPFFVPDGKHLPLFAAAFVIVSCRRLAMERVAETALRVKTVIAGADVFAGWKI